jgi:hypothetical protein
MASIEQVMEREFCYFLPSYEYAFHIQFISPNIRPKLNPTIEKKANENSKPYKEVQTKV